MQKHKFQPKVAYGACWLMLIVATAMLFMREYRVAAMIGAQSVFFFCLAFNATKSAVGKRHE